MRNKWYFVSLLVQEFHDKNTTFNLFIDGCFDSQGSMWQYKQCQNVGITCGKFKRINSFEGLLGDFLLYAEVPSYHEIKELYMIGLESLQNGGF